MIKQWLGWVNYCLLAVAGCLILIGCAYLFWRPSEILISETPLPKTALPKRSFEMSKEAYEAIGEPLLALQFAPLSMQLPDLKRYLIYYGKNGRPDAMAEKPLLHFSFSGNKIVSSVTPGEKLYLLYDRKLNPAQYIFSPGNSPSSLWIEAGAEGNEAQVKVAMQGENGELITEPESNAGFTSPEKEFVRFGGTAWEIGSHRVDATLLARQKARWHGTDLFLTKHGGPEYGDMAGKHRIDFGEGEETYCVYVDVNDALIWENDQWKVVKPGRESLGKPLLVIKKSEDRLKTMELWDPEGKGKITLNLLKSMDAPTSANVQNNFKFVGARTRTQFVFEIDGQRMLLSPHDWLLSTKEGWIKLQTPDEIDAYVDRKLVGSLFVFDAIEKREDKLSLVGTLFNASRADMQSVEIPLQQGTPSSNPPSLFKGDDRQKQIKKPVKNSIRGHVGHDEEDEDDDEDDD
jgi:hypothetical protein